MKSATTPTTPEHFKAMLAVLLVNPAKGTVRHARDIPCKHILTGDDAGRTLSRGVQIAAAGYRVARSKLVWFAATGEVPDRVLLRKDGDCLNDAIGNLQKPHLPEYVKSNGGGFCAALTVSGSTVSGPSRRTVAEAEADAALMLKVRAAA